MSSSTPESEALALFQSGRLEEAEAAWRAILARKPDDPDALHLLGCVMAQSGRREEGLQLIDRSLEHAPRSAAFLNNRARVLIEAGRAEEALRDLRRSVQLEPAFYAGYCHLGNVLRALGRLDEATAAFRRAAALDPRGADALVGLGNVQLEKKEYAQAEASLRSALQGSPRHSNALNSLGIVLRHSGRDAQARDCFERSLAADARNADALNNLGVLLQDEGRLDEAIAHYARAVEARPDFAQVFLNWGNVLKDRGDLEGARRLYERALSRAPQFVAALCNVAGIALDSGRMDEARELYRRAAEQRPDLADPRYGLAQIALREQRFEDGWEGYELRFDTSPPQAARRSFSMPRLARQEFGKPHRVAIWSEQGTGDQILFSTLLPDLSRHGVRAVVEIDSRLASIYRRSLPSIEFTTPPEAPRAFESCDREMPLGSLARLLRPCVASFAQQPCPLLAADPGRVARMRERLGAGRWIAISWRSLQPGSRQALGERKSIPLEHFARIAQATGARLLDLQYGDVGIEREAFEARHPGVLVRLDALDTYNDFEGVLAAIEACERVVTSSNVTAHLAGALGKATSLLFLRAWPPFHYWAAGPASRSLWYPSVEVSDASWTSWEQAFEAVSARLSQPQHDAV